MQLSKRRALESFGKEVERERTRELEEEKVIFMINLLRIEHYAP
jgi:hypothetical protein